MNVLPWPGQLMQTYEVPNGNPLLSGTTGQIDSVRGTDPLPYATGVLRSWTVPGLTTDPADPSFWLGTSADLGPSDAGAAPVAPSWKNLAIGALVAVVAVIVLAIGLAAVVREG